MKTQKIKIKERNAWSCSRKGVLQRLLIGISLVLVLVTQTLTAFSVKAATSNIGLEAYAIDSIAGFSALLKTKKSVPNQEMEFWIKKPTGSVLIIESKTDDEGIAKADLYDYHTKIAGMYEISAKWKGNSPLGPGSNFRIYPDEVSEENSRIDVNRQTAISNSIDAITLTVTLVDRYGNAIENHTVELISSRPEDTVKRTSKNPFTDENGKMNFIISSNEPGISVYTVYDSVASKTLKNRVKAVYYESKNEQFSQIGGDDVNTGDLRTNNERFLLTQATTQEKISYLKIENIPDIVAPNEILSFTVTAYDASDIRSTQYLGTIHFSATDRNAQLPQDYTFTEDDLGSHTFSLGLKFLNQGMQTLEIVDINNLNLRASKIINVSTKKVEPVEDKTIILLSPLDGTYATNDISVEGEAPKGWMVKIYDNDENVGETLVGNDNTFRFSLNDLTSGLHTIHAILVDNDGKSLDSSQKVTIDIDQKAPMIDQIIIEPSGAIEASERFTIKVYTEEKLRTLSVLIDLRLIELTEELDEPGVYQAVIDAPKTPGEYDIDIVLIDELGNDSSYEKYLTLQVGETNDNMPKKVGGFTLTEEEKKITLNWEASLSDTEIDHYQIFYGTDEKNIDNTVNTLDSSLTWYIPNLIPGQTYYFEIVAVDSQGNESKKSEMIYGTPFGIVYPSKVEGIKSEEGIEKVTLSWLASTDDTSIDHYRIYYGEKRENLEKKIETTNDKTTWYIGNLTPGITYYFALSAIDSDGYESEEKSEIVSAKPIEPPLPKENPQSGPITDFLIILALLGSETYVLQRYFQAWKKYKTNNVMVEKQNENEEESYYSIS
ncbi:fibronectin type III domain-containing protein [Candidatus Peregrinibacteria bacterium]|nr:fibronectin type III domain-containing protein [Candidatus Peregrinibacteria bacterium]